MHNANLRLLESAFRNALTTLKLDLPVHVCMAEREAVNQSVCEGGAYALVDENMLIIAWGKSNKFLKVQTLYRLLDYQSARYVIHVDSAHTIDALQLKRCLEKTVEVRPDYSFIDLFNTGLRRRR